MPKSEGDRSYDKVENALTEGPAVVFVSHRLFRRRGVRSFSDPQTSQPVTARWGDRNQPTAVARLAVYSTSQHTEHEK